MIIYLYLYRNMGLLYIVPTPVGNLEDMTMRAVRVLKEADLILAEDTRTSGVLLKHFNISNKLMSHHKFNEHGTSASIVERLKAVNRETRAAHHKTSCRLMSNLSDDSLGKWPRPSPAILEWRLIGNTPCT